MSCLDDAQGPTRRRPSTGATHFAVPSLGEVIPKFMLRAMAGRELVIFGDGSQTRDFTWVGDVARGIIAAGEVGDAVGQTLNLGFGREIAIRQLAAEVTAVVGGSEARVVFDSPRPGDVGRLCADTSRARGLLAGGGLWAGVVGANLAVAWLRTGDPVLRILDGRPAGWYLLPLAAGVPCLAGFLTAAAAGDRFRYLTAGMAMAAVVPLNVLFALLAVPGLVHLGLLGGLAVVGGVPTWTYLAGAPTPAPQEAGPASGR